MNFKPAEDPLYARLRALDIPLWGLARLLGEDSPHPSTLSRMLRSLIVFPENIKTRIKTVIETIEKEKNQQ